MNKFSSFGYFYIELKVYEQLEQRAKVEKSFGIRDRMELVGMNRPTNFNVTGIYVC